MPALGHTVTEEVIQADHDADARRRVLAGVPEPPDRGRPADVRRRDVAGVPVDDVAARRGAVLRGGRDPGSGVGVDRGGRLGRRVEHPCGDRRSPPRASTGSSNASRSFTGAGIRGRSLSTRLPRLGASWSTWRPCRSRLRWSALGSTRRGAGSSTTPSSPGTVVHLDQPVLNAAVAAARKRALGDAWAWARRVGDRRVPAGGGHPGPLRAGQARGGHGAGPVTHDVRQWAAVVTQLLAVRPRRPRVSVCWRCGPAWSPAGSGCWRSGSPSRSAADGFGPAADPVVAERAARFRWGGRRCGPTQFMAGPEQQFPVGRA